MTNEFNIRNRLFMNSLFDIEIEHLDYFIEHNRLQDYFRIYYVEATSECKILFIDNATLPDEIKQKCLDLFTKTFSLKDAPYNADQKLMNKERIFYTPYSDE